MLINRCFLLSLFLLISIAAHTQQLPSGAVRLKEEIAQAKLLLQKIQEKRASLESLSNSFHDSTSLEQELDSLQQIYADSTVFQQYADSLRRAFSGREAALQQLGQAALQLEEEIAAATKAYGLELLPEQAAQALARLEQESASSASSLLPDKIQLDKVGIGLLPKPELLQEQVKTAAIQTVEAHLDGQQAELEKYKERVKDFRSVKEVKKEALKKASLRHEPLLERIYLGSLWQFGSREQFVIDVGPFAAWRFTDKISAGAGVQYRLSLSLKEKPYLSTSTDKVWGYFVFTDVEVWKGIFTRLHYEHLIAPVSVPGNTEQTGREWVPGLSVGVGKSYTYYRSLKGFALVRYNLMHTHNKSPYLQPLQATIGFYIFGSSLQSKK